MTEPLGPRPRPTAMKILVLLVAVLVVLAGCGNERAGSTDKTRQGSTSAPTTQVGGCAADSPQVTKARTLATAYLDGDGTVESVKLTGPGGECGSTLFAKLGTGFVAVAVGAADPPVGSAFAVDLKGHDGQLLVTRADHPRGGYQLRVYAAGDGRLVELLVDLFLMDTVATDVQEHPWSIDCSTDGLVFTQAVPHEPVGVVATWD